jgi:hypothetical protein
MSKLTFPTHPDGLFVDVVVNLELATLLPLRASGQSCPPIPARALIDTASDLTVVSPAILQQLAIKPITLDQYNRNRRPRLR